MTDRHAVGVANWDARKQKAGREIASQRRLWKFTQEELAAKLAEALGGDATVTQSAISFWESGRSAPAPEKLPTIEQVLGMPQGSLSAMLYDSPKVVEGKAHTEIALHAKIDRLSERERRAIEAQVDALLEED